LRLSRPHTILLALILASTLLWGARLTLSSLDSDLLALEGGAFTCNSWDAIALVRGVIDGDTFRAIVTCASEPFKEKIGVGVEYRIRLADIDAPEISTEEGVRAWRALENIIQGKTVLLDVDDIGVFDRYGRIIAVAYIEYNKTHVLNINKWTIETGNARIWDHQNEFNPEKWNLYEPKKSVVEVAQVNNRGNQTTLDITLITLTLLIGVILALLLTLLLKTRK
jgi:Micrococcal nuclease (thermonuclease) homologs